MDNDADIRDLLMHGDAAALTLIHQLHGKLLHGLLLGYLGRAQEADDAFQDLFVNISQQREKIARSRNVVAYLVTMTRNIAITALRRRRRQRREQPPDADLFSSPQQMVDGESSTAVTAALMSLPEEQREIMILKVWQERTFAEIGSMLGISINTAASRYRYASEKLRLELKAWR